MRVRSQRCMRTNDSRLIAVREILRCERRNGCLEKLGCGHWVAIGLRSKEARRGMAERRDRVLPALLILTFVTGLVDAVSFLGLGHVFTANMTGNIVFLGF